MSDKLEDIFSGELELTASERGFILLALSEHYMRGGWCPVSVNKGAFLRAVATKIGRLPLTKMVSPDGKSLISVEEHDKLVAKMYPELCTK